LSVEQTSGGESEPNDELSLLDLALVLAENLKLLIAVPLAAGVVALVIGFLTSPTYTATARILSPQQQQNSAAAMAAQLGALAGLVGGAAGIKSPADQYVALLKSRTVYDAIIQRFDLKTLYESRYLEDARKTLDGRVRVFAGVKDGIISIDVDDHDPARAADMANAFVEELRKLTNTLAVSEAAQRRLFFETQLKQAKNNLTTAEVVLRASGVSEATLKTVPQAQLEALARLKAQIAAQEIKLASMRTYMTDSNADLRVGLQELSALRAELAKAEQSNSTPAHGEGGEYVAKYRDFKYHETLFELMAKQYELARLDEAREGTVIQVVDAAQPPERKSKPRKAVNAILTTLAVGFLMIIVLFIRHGFRRTLAQPDFAAKLARLRRLVLFRRA
jgi:uncharacterized protein involved in exopolysaccharide biosynthesis